MTDQSNGFPDSCSDSLQLSTKTDLYIEKYMFFNKNEKKMNRGHNNAILRQKGHLYNYKSLISASN